MRPIDANKLIARLKELYAWAGWDLHEIHFSLSDMISNIEGEPTVKLRVTATLEQKWIPVSKKLPETTDPVNVTWINRNSEPYYESIKNKPFTGTAHYYEGKWWWDSPVCQDYLNEYGRSPCDEIHPDIEITAWQSLPEPYKAQEEE